jgi:hypothetical protein
MPQITVSDETLARLQAFERVARALTDETRTPDELADVLIRFGMDQTLTVLWGSLEPGALVKTLLALAERHPGQVYSLTAEYLEAGAGIEKEELRRRFGFQPPERTA